MQWFLLWVFKEYHISMLLSNILKQYAGFDRVTSLCRGSSVIEARMVFAYVNGGTDAALDASKVLSFHIYEYISIFY